MWKLIWSRFMNLFKSKALSALDAAENPVEMYELAVRESEVNIQNITKAIALALADQKMRERELNQARLECEAWQQKAKVALTQGQEALARAALEHKHICAKKAEEYYALNEMLKSKIEEQKKQLQRVKVKHEELKAKKSIYTAKYETAKAQNKMAESLGGLNASGLGDVARLEEKINKLEAESEALFELTEGSNEVQVQLDEVQVRHNVEEDLSKLQNEIITADRQKQEERMKALGQELMKPGHEAEKDKLLNEFYSKKKDGKGLSDNKDILNDFFKK